MITRFLGALAPAVLAGLIAFPAVAQVSNTELVMRLERMENQLRQLTGAIEQLQYRNQQLEQQLGRMQESSEPRSSRQARPAAPAPTLPPVPPQVTQPQTMPAQPMPQRRSEAEDDQPPPALPRPQRRADVFDPVENPNAPGTPRLLGRPGAPVVAGPPISAPPPSYPPNAYPPAGAYPPAAAPDDDDIGAPGGRRAGEPLDLSTLSRRAAADPAPAMPSAPPVVTLPPPPARNPNATGATQMVMAPTATPKDEYDLAYGYVLRKDYALGEEAFRAFLKKYPSDRMVADANYWLGETLFQRQRYRDAAEAFLTVSTKFESSAKAPDSLLRLGQSLAALKEKEAACATWAEIGRKYPRLSPTVKQHVEREQKRGGC